MGINKTRKILNYFPSSDNLLLNWNGLLLVAFLFLLLQAKSEPVPLAFLTHWWKEKESPKWDFFHKMAADEWYYYSTSWVIWTLCYHSSMGQHTNEFQFNDSHDGHHIPSWLSPPKEQSWDSWKLIPLPFPLPPKLPFLLAWWGLLYMVPQEITYATPMPSPISFPLLIWDRAMVTE